MKTFKVNYSSLTEKKMKCFNTCKEDKNYNRVTIGCINLYALILMVKDFLTYIDNTTMEKMTFGSGESPENDIGFKKIIEECSSDPKRYIASGFYLKDNIDEYNPQKHSGTIRNSLKKLFEFRALLYTMIKSNYYNKYRKCYILPQVEQLQWHCERIKRASIATKTKYRRLQDTAYIIISSFNPESFLWDFRELRHTLIKKQISIVKKNPDMIYFLTAKSIQEKQEKEIWQHLNFIESQSITALIAFRGGVTLVNWEKTTITLTDIGYEIFDLELFMDDWISFMQEDCLVILSRKYVRGDFDKCLKYIEKIRDGQSKYKVKDFNKILKGYTGDRLNALELIQYLEDNDVLVSEDFKEKLQSFSNGYLCDAFKKFQGERNGQNFIKASVEIDFNLLYKSSSPWLGKYMTLDKVSLAWFEQKTNFDIRDFIKRYKGEDDGPVIIRTTRFSDPFEGIGL